MYRLLAIDTSFAAPVKTPLPTTKHHITTLLTILALFGGALNAAPLKVFILAGQSNLEGHAKI
jgi:hypothetical protein